MFDNMAVLTPETKGKITPHDAKVLRRYRSQFGQGTEICAARLHQGLTWAMFFYCYRSGHTELVAVSEKPIEFALSIDQKSQIAEIGE